MMIYQTVIMKYKRDNLKLINLRNRCIKKRKTHPK